MAMIKMDDRANPPLQVCQLISSFRPVIGGAERATEQLSAALRRDGVDVIILTRRKSPLDTLFEYINGVPVYRLGNYNLGKLGALMYVLHSFWLLAVRFRSYHIVHAQNTDTPLLLGFLVKIFLGKKLILTIHGGNPIRDYAQSQLGKFRLLLMKAFVDRFTAITIEVQEQLQTLGVPLSRIALIPNGIDINTLYPPSAPLRYLARERLNLPKTELVVIFIGRLHKIKRVDLLLHAWARLPHLAQDQLLVVGAGEELDQLKDLAVQLGINIGFKGSTDDVAPYLHAADVFVLPSGIRSTSSYEGLSVALMEAMSTGLAVLATDCPGNRVLIQDGENGLLFPVEDVDELTKQLERLLEDPSLRARLGRNAHTSVYQNYAIEAIARKTKTIYERIRNAEFHTI